jgi:hypothetical protein
MAGSTGLEPAPLPWQGSSVRGQDVVPLSANYDLLQWLCGLEALFANSAHSFSVLLICARTAETQKLRGEVRGEIFRAEKWFGYIVFGFCMTGSVGVDAYLARRQFERQSTGQGFDGAFRGSSSGGTQVGGMPDRGALKDGGRENVAL